MDTEGHGYQAFLSTLILRPATPRQRHFPRRKRPNEGWVRGIIKERDKLDRMTVRVLKVKLCRWHPANDPLQFACLRADVYGSERTKVRIHHRDLPGRSGDGIGREIPRMWLHRSRRKRGQHHTDGASHWVRPGNGAR